MQIELVQQRCDTPSMYRDFLQTSGEGQQHMAFWPDDYDAACHAALAEGYMVGQEGALPRGRFVYFQSSAHAGTVFEFNEIAALSTPSGMRQPIGTAAIPSAAHERKSGVAGQISGSMAACGPAVAFTRCR